MEAGEFARRWRASPTIAAFLGRLADAGDEAAVEAAVRTLLADDAWVTQTIAALVRRARDDPDAAPPFAPMANALQQGLVLLDDEKVTIALAVTGVDALATRKVEAGGRGSIGFDGGLSLYRVLDGGGATIGWWEAPPIHADFTRSTGARCRHVGHERMEDGGWLRVDGRRQAFIIERAERDIVLVQAVVKTGRAGLLVEYDAQTQDVLGTSATDPAASHARMLMTLLTLTGATEGVEVVRPLLADPAFFVRWDAARALLRLDRDAGRAAVRGLADDPHPDVRAGARTVLDAWERQPCRA